MIKWMIKTTSRTRCRCGHDGDVHEHFRRGSDCSTCGPNVCRRFADPAPARPVVRLPQTTTTVVAGLAWNLLRTGR